MMEELLKAGKEVGKDYLTLFLTTLFKPEIDQTNKFVKDAANDLRGTVKTIIDSFDPVKALGQTFQKLDTKQKNAQRINDDLQEYEKLKNSTKFEDKIELDKIIKDLMTLINNPKLVVGNGKINKDIARQTLDNITKDVSDTLRKAVNKANLDSIQIKKDTVKTEKEFDDLIKKIAATEKLSEQYQNAKTPTEKTNIYNKAVKERLIDPFSTLSQSPVDQGQLEKAQFDLKLGSLGQEQKSFYEKLAYLTSQFGILQRFIDQSKSGAEPKVFDQSKVDKSTTNNKVQTPTVSLTANQFKTDMKELLDPISQKLTGITKDISNSKQDILKAIGSKDPQHRALGGPVSEGQVYFVGENGPELFIANSNGTIISNNQLGGGDGGLFGGGLFSGLTAVIKDLTAKIQDLIAKISPDVTNQDKPAIQTDVNPTPQTIGTTPGKGEDKNNSWGTAWNQSISTITGQMQTWSQQMQQITDQTAQSMQKTMNDFFFDAFSGKLKNLGDYVSGFLTSVQQSIANAMAQMFTKQLMSWLKIPGFASGGPVDSDRPYIVGERGPELFVPGLSGSIIPNHQLSGIANGNTQGTGNTGSNVTVNVINQSGTAVDAKQGQAKVTPDGIIIPVILKALETNQMGLRDVLQAAR